jgi:signal transduction histidine kinase
MESGGNLWITTRHLPPPIGAKRGDARTPPKGYVEIRFRDDGPGIPESIQEKLFDPYVSSKQGGHSGLGLSIAYNIIKSFEGNIACERISDQGAEFKIELPVQEGA